MVMGAGATNVPIPRQIARLPTWKVVTRPTSKNWQAKIRIRVDIARTVPHGFNAFGDEDEAQEVLEAMEFMNE